MARHGSYDHMMAELQLDEDDRAAGSAVGKRSRYARTHLDTKQSSSSEDERKEREPRGASERRGRGRSNNSEASKGEQEARSSSSASDKSDDSREARVRSARTEQFSARGSVDSAGTSMAVGSAAAECRVEINALRGFLTRAPKRGAPLIQCFVERNRQGLSRLHPVYRLFLSDGKQSLLCAQKRANSTTANYLLTMEKNPSSSRRDALIVGKLRSNWSGSEYVVYDDGISPSKTALETNVRCVLGKVEFSYDETGPGRLTVRIPRVQSSGAPDKCRDWDAPASSSSSRSGSDSSSTSARPTLNDGGVLDAVSCLLLRNKQPQFDAKTGGHVLDFGGRVTMPSIKNFQLQCDDNTETVLQFGRVSCQPRSQCKCHKNIFNMDVQYPLNPLQAFAICLATLDTKFTDSKLYDSVSKLMTKKLY